MTKDEDFKLLKIQTCVLRMNIDCDGCKFKVKKLLQKIEGVYAVSIDADQQKVTVSGSIDPSTLMKKLIRSGKHAELWSDRSNQNQKQKNNCINNDKNNNGGQKQGILKGVDTFKNQQKLPAFNLEDEGYLDEEEDETEDERMRFIRGLQLRQQAAAAAAEANGAGVPNNVKVMNNVVNGTSGKKGNAAQNVVMKPNPGGGAIDPHTIAALQMNNQHMAMNSADPRMRMGNEIGKMQGNVQSGGGYQGNNPNIVVLGGNNMNGFGGYQVQQQNNGFPNNGMVTGNHPTSMMMNMHGCNHPSSSIMMNGIATMQQPQMMYHRSPYIPATTGYYYGYNPAPYSYMEQPSYHYHHQQQHYPSEDTAPHMFGDENTSSSCSIIQTARANIILAEIANANKRYRDQIDQRRREVRSSQQFELGVKVY
ncbi:Heavy metal-associated isoprenylated plant protein 37-like protein [Drosera capensis]